jgi:hypothetical protein
MHCVFLTTAADVFFVLHAPTPDRLAALLRCCSAGPGFALNILKLSALVLSKLLRSFCSSAF